MGLFSPEFVTALKARGIAWFATATTASEAIRAQTAGWTRSSRKGSRLAAIAAPSTKPRPNGKAWDCLPWSPH
jgi:hypothetical protein